MSEFIPGLPAAPAPPRPRDAAAVVLYRRTGAGVEVFWLKRGAQLSFAGGYYAFPGGQLDAGDAQVPVRGCDAEAGALRVAAARELFEETGVLVARGAAALTPEQLLPLRLELLSKARRFGDILKDHGLELDADDFPEAGRYVTPPSQPVRFDCRFFLVEAPPNAHAEVIPGELAEGAWVTPAAALARWTEGSALLHPPNHYALEVMAAFTTKEAALESLQSPPHLLNFTPVRVEFQKGVRVFPLETPTLPPAAHTNCYLLGNADLLIVDPGASDVRECARLLALIAGLKVEGKRAVAVVLTHHHEDHIGGAENLRERLQIPIWCHARTAERLRFAVDRTLEDGEVLTLAGVPTMRWQVLHTPGHARGHLCLLDLASRAAVVGDMVAGYGTIVIDPPEGDMTDYLAQLTRLKDLPVHALYPAHGPALADGPAKLAEYLRHRQAREHRVLDAVKAKAGTLQDISARAYEDTPAAPPQLAERSTQAILIKLTRDGKVHRVQDTYALKP